MSFQLASTQLSAVSAYNKAQTQTAESAIISNYNDLFTQISAAASAGQTSLTYSLLNRVGDQSALSAMLVKYGYTASIANNMLTVDWSAAKTISISSSALAGFNITNVTTAVDTYTFVELKPVGGLAPYTFANVNSLTIDGLIIDTTRSDYIIISGRPKITELLLSYLTFSITDSTWPVPQTVLETVDLNIAQQVAITGTNITSFTGQTGVPLNVSIRPTGGIYPYTFSLLSSDLGAGLAATFDSSACHITGTPINPVVSIGNIVLSITDSKGYNLKQDISYTITGKALTFADTNPVITGFNLNSFTGITGTLLSVSLKPIGGNAPYTFSFTGNLPKNCSYTSTSNSFNINGAPDTPTVQVATLTVTATTKDGFPFSQDITYTITQGPVVNLGAGLGTSYISALSMMMP